MLVSGGVVFVGFFGCCTVVSVVFVGEVALLWLWLLMEVLVVLKWVTVFCYQRVVGWGWLLMMGMSTVFLSVMKFLWVWYWLRVLALLGVGGNDIMEKSGEINWKQGWGFGYVEEEKNESKKVILTSE